MYYFPSYSLNGLHVKKKKKNTVMVNFAKKLTVSNLQVPNQGPYKLQKSKRIRKFLIIKKR
jgi:hypothetical protein